MVDHGFDWLSAPIVVRREHCITPSSDFTFNNACCGWGTQNSESFFDGHGGRAGRRGGAGGGRAFELFFPT